LLATIGADTDEPQIQASFGEAIENRKGAKGDFASKAARGNLRRIPSPKTALSSGDSDWVFCPFKKRRCLIPLEGFYE